MDRNIFIKNYAKKLTELNQQISTALTGLLNHLILVESSLLGIPTLLPEKTHASGLLRYLFVAIVVLLLISILTSAVVQYMQLRYIEKLRELYVKESEKAFREDRLPNLVKVAPRKIVLFCRSTAFAGFVSAACLLALYVVLKTLA